MHLTDPQRRLLRIRGRARAGSERPAPAEVRTYLSGPVTVPAAAAAVVEVTAAPSGEERRRFDRVALHSELAIRRVGGFSFQVAIKNISSAGNPPVAPLSTCTGTSARFMGVFFHPRHWIECDTA